jgi:anti-sigma B factor antagonist
MQNQATTRQAGNIAIVDLSGHITAGGTGALRNAIKELAAAGQKNVLLNITQVTYIDSSGLGELVDACTTFRKLGGDLKLVGPQPRITKLLEMTKLSSVFKVFAEEQAALGSF